MKCIAAVVMMALAVAAEASYVPAAYAHHGYGYHAAPVVAYGAQHHVYNPTVVQSNDHHSWAHHAYAHPAPVAAYNAYAHHVPAAVTAYDSHWDHHHVPAVAVAAPVHHSASYVAANPGAVHKAPLAGHIVNQKSLNLAPAPGTW